MAIGTCELCGEEAEIDKFGVCQECVTEIEGELTEEDEAENAQQHAAEQKTLDGSKADQSHVKGTPESRERTEAILKLLGFISSQEKNGPRWRKEIGNLKIAFDFTAEHPEGRVWAKRKGEKNFLEDDEIKALPILQIIRTLLNDYDQLPPAVLVGTVLAKSDKGIHIQIDDSFEGPKQVWYGLKAVKRNTPGSQGYNPDIADNERYIPAGFSARSAQQEAKLKLPRPIVLEQFEQQLQKASVHTHQNGDHVSQEEQSPPEPTTMAEKMNGDSSMKTSESGNNEKEEAYTQQTRKQIRSIRETFEIAYDEAETFVAKKIAPALEARLKQEGEYITFEKEIGIAAMLEDYTLRIANHLSIELGYNQRSGRY